MKRLTVREVLGVPYSLSDKLLKLRGADRKRLRLKGHATMIIHSIKYGKMLIFDSESYFQFETMVS